MLDQTCCENAIELKQISKSFVKKDVLDELDLAVPVGSIYAFLGNNGEGKSTTIRIITGLEPPDKGSITLLGQIVNHKKARSDRRWSQNSYLSQVGCLVESPSLYPNLTAEEFLQIGCWLKKLPETEIKRVLSLVSLPINSKLLTSEYSLGMKQRLAIAHALLGEPRLLILDEPTNGLDPEGIKDIRQLISRLPKLTGCTVFFSTHNLDEVEKMATHFCVLQGGKVRFQSSMQSWLLTQQNNMIFELSDVEQANQLLVEQGIDSSVINSQQLQVRNLANGAQAKLHSLLIKSGFELYQSYYIKNSLEQWFIGEKARGV